MMIVLVAGARIPISHTKQLRGHQRVGISRPPGWMPAGSVCSEALCLAGRGPPDSPVCRSWACLASTDSLVQLTAPSSSRCDDSQPTTRCHRLPHHGRRLAAIPEQRRAGNPVLRYVRCNQLRLAPVHRLPAAIGTQPAHIDPWRRDSGFGPNKKNPVTDGVPVGGSCRTRTLPAD